MKPASILIVDDEPDNFDVIETLLLNLDYGLYYAASGAAAIDSLETLQPDLILLDVMMPKMDGIEVCQRIKALEQWKTVPIIMVTALNTKADLARCLQVGADDFIGKPINGLELRARVQSMLRIKQQHDSLQSFSRLQRNTINLLSDNLTGLRNNLALSLPHELNTPLNGILGTTQLLIDGVDEMDAKDIHQLLDLSYQSACRLAKLTQRFLNYLYLELTTASLQEEKTDPHKKNQISSSQAIVVPLAQAIADKLNRGKDLVYQVIDTPVPISALHLQWIVEELLDNAFKFSQPQTPVTVRGECREELFHFWVSNLGQGMTAQQIASIGAFMQFERRTYAQQGAGLGLKIVQKVVELYGGRFRISSIHQQELTVHITLPLEAQSIKAKPNLAEMQSLID